MYFLLEKLDFHCHVSLLEGIYTSQATMGTTYWKRYMLQPAHFPRLWDVWTAARGERSVWELQSTNLGEENMDGMCQQMRFLVELKKCLPSGKLT